MKKKNKKRYFLHYNYLLTAANVALTDKDKIGRNIFSSATLIAEIIYHLVDKAFIKLCHLVYKAAGSKEVNEKEFVFCAVEKLILK